MSVHDHVHRASLHEGMVTLVERIPSKRGRKASVYMR